MIKAARAESKNLLAKLLEEKRKSSAWQHKYEQVEITLRDIQSNSDGLQSFLSEKDRASTLIQQERDQLKERLSGVDHLQQEREELHATILAQENEVELLSRELQQYKDRGVEELMIENGNLKIQLEASEKLRLDFQQENEGLQLQLQEAKTELEDVRRELFTARTLPNLSEKSVQVNIEDGRQSYDQGWQDAAVQLFREAHRKPIRSAGRHTTPRVQQPSSCASSEIEYVIPHHHIYLSIDMNYLFVGRRDHRVCIICMSTLARQRTSTCTNNS